MYQKNNNTPLINNVKIISVITLIYSLIGCNTIKNTFIQPHNIIQGHYFTKDDIKTINIGMTKSEIFDNIGIPTLKSLFEFNTWYYVYYHYKNNTIIKHQTLILKFDENDTLIDINYQE